VAGLAIQASLGQIFYSAPSNVAVDSLARYLDQTTRSIYKRYNEVKWLEDPTRLRYRLIVRGYNKNQEIQAFVSLLENPDFVPPVKYRKYKHLWELPLSIAY
jgi:hypothetical protein